MRPDENQIQFQRSWEVMKRRQKGDKALANGTEKKIKERGIMMVRAKKGLWVGFCLAIVASIWMAPELAFGQTKAEGSVLKWKMATSWPTGIPLYTDMAKVLPDVVKKMSGGRLIITPFAAGAIAPALEVADATRRGVCEMAHTWIGYDIGISAACVVLGGFPGSMEAEPKLHWTYHGGGYPLWQEFRREKFNLVAFPGGIWATEIFAHSNRPIRTLADFKGLKFRTVGAFADIMPKLGASVISLPGGEVLQSLERKAIDATEWSTPGGNLPMGFHDIAKYVIIPGVHQPSASFEFVINPKAWGELPDDLKAIVEEAAKIVTLESWTKAGVSDIGAMEVYKKRGNVIMELDKEVQTKIYKLGGEWADQHAAKDPWVKRILESQRKFEEGWKEVMKNRALKIE